MKSVELMLTALVAIGFAVIMGFVTNHAVAAIGGIFAVVLFVLIYGILLSYYRKQEGRLHPPATAKS